MQLRALYLRGSAARTRPPDQESVARPTSPGRERRPPTVVHGSPPRWLSLWLSLCAKAVQPVVQVGRWIVDLDDLVPAGSPRDQPDRTPWNTERHGERLERGLGGLTVHRTLLYGHDQRTSRAVRSVRAPDPGAPRARLDPDGDADARGRPGRLGLLRS